MVEEDHEGRASLLLFGGRYLVVKSVGRLFFKKETKKIFCCNSCSKVFPSEGELERHTVLGCYPSQTKRSKVECDLCDRQGRSGCLLHLDLSRIGGDRLARVMVLREEIFNPKRVGDIFFNDEGDMYKAILKEVGWGYIYLGREENVRIVGVDENGKRVGMKHSYGSTGYEDCGFCSMFGVDVCYLHKTTNLYKFELAFRDLVTNVNRKSDVNMHHGGLVFEAMFSTRSNLTTTLNYIFL